MVIPDNRVQADQRLNQLKKKMQKNSCFATEYKTFMKDLIDRGHAELVRDSADSQSDRSDEVNKRWFIPHHGVYHPRKPEKLRVVFDFAASYSGFSLNDNLLQGPDLTNKLIGVLIRFHQEDIALTADVVSVFYQVRVPPEDHGFLSFLWWIDGDYNKYPSVYQMCVHLFGASSSPSCANYALKKTANDNIDISEDACKIVHRNFYVDDCLLSVPSVKQAVAVVGNLRKVCMAGGFKLTKWTSNTREVLETIPENERSKDLQGLDLDRDPMPMSHALGVHWSIENDTFLFKVELKDRPITRRGILSVTSSFYDPLGFAAPVVLQRKIILQDLCRLGLDWDEEIPEDIKERWLK
jgi:hypothetical protein